MDLTFQNKTVTYLKPVMRELRTQEQTQELIVPDSFPDVGRIVSCSAQATLRGKECSTGSVVISGAVQAVCLYEPETEGGAKSLEAYLPFTVRMDSPGVSPSVQVVTRLRVKSCEARMLNSRKVILRILIACLAEGYEQTEQTLCEVQDAPPELQQKLREYTLILPRQTGEKSFSMTEEADIPEEKPAASRIVLCTMLPGITEKKMVGGKALFKGKLLCACLYQTEDGLFESVTQQFPFSQFCEMSEEESEAELAVDPILTGFDAQITAEGRRLVISADITAQCLASDAQVVTVCEDAYVTKGELKPVWTEYDFSCRLDRQQMSATVRRNLEAHGKGVLWSDFWLDFPETEQNGDTVRISAPTEIQAVYYDEEGRLQAVRAKAEAECESALHADALCVVSNALTADSYVLLGASGAEARVDTEVCMASFAPEALRTLSGGQIEEKTDGAAEKPVVILKVISARRSVWDLAKEYGTSVEAIRAANGSLHTEAEAGELLLIPKC